MPYLTDAEIEVKYQSDNLGSDLENFFRSLIGDSLFDASLGDASAKAAKIANEIQQKFLTLADPEICLKDYNTFSEAVENHFSCLNVVIASCTGYFPPDHHFQDTLVQVVENLHRLDGPDPDHRFEDLPYFGIFMRDFLNDWTEDYEFYPDEFRRNGWKVEEVVSRWKCMTSFYSRISFVGRGTIYGIWECRRALEEPEVTGPLMETRLYGATEFIIRCGECWCDTYFKNPPLDLDEGSKRMFWPGKLIKGSGIPLFGKGRLEWWRKRLVDIKDNWQRYMLDEVTPERLERAILKLDSIMASIDWEAATERNG